MANEPQREPVDDEQALAEARPLHEQALYAVNSDSPTFETRINPLADSVDEAADVTINHVIADPGSHQSNHGNTGYGEDDDHHDMSDLKTRARLRGRS